MASAVLVSRNETSNFLSQNQYQPPRTTSTNFMGKIPFLNPNPNPNFTNINNNHHFSRKQLNHQNGDEFLNPSTASDDVSSFSHHRKPGDGGGGGEGGVSFSQLRIFDISSFSKSEILVLKARLMSELDRVRSLTNRIESGEFPNVSNYNNNNNHHLPKKRPLPFQPPMKEAKRGKHQQQLQQQLSYVASPQVMKMCAQVLSKVMKQKAGYVFNEPVDVVGMGLHDYHQIVKKPMDLGTIKKKMGERVYLNPDDFAADVRLTFTNALMYNPKGHEVNTLAERFLAKFEQYFRPVYHKFQMEKQLSLRPHKVGIPTKEDFLIVDEVQESSWSRNPSPELPKMMEHPPNKPEPRLEPRLEPLPSRLIEPTPIPAPLSAPVPAPVLGPVQVQPQEVVREATMGRVGRGPSGKLPKPKAKDPYKRDMTMEEKHKLGAGLQSLPEEKMTQVIQIIRKRNGHLTQDGDEIELDIEAVDKETLWELDRFVTNFKKMVSKLNRQALMQNNNVGLHDDSNQVVGGTGRVMEIVKAVKIGGGDLGDEDVDIGDEMPVQNFPPVEIDKDDDRNQGGGGGGGAGNGGASSDTSSSGNSTSDSSSSSDSDSGSSSGSDSDVDDAQSRDNESKNIPH